MRLVIQRVNHAGVQVSGKEIASCGKGLLVLLGVTHDDSMEDVEYCASKTLGLRIFEDEDEKMNLSIQDIHGEILVVSQFTLYGDIRKGRRPSFVNSAKPDKANELYEEYVKYLQKENILVSTGQFGADMKVELINDGPVTILVDSKKMF
ncbi:D-tyrosyl-tRNA(Tyr) deacylase [Filifactor alocis ATCC 35896]|jgi:D-tyrosyl-tRNA(Tyr) deacylase|uniref:D-aminoacyl-tRNA deacylase n=1 Tax=Filifactor alocis (strain ATCC 35896 / CCUG 47790 / D40 B5) TaxID=546269 RepID=D6GSB1_FILAD|nr:D-aminoacyl-tRNA deacylase [Filifactor alocis]EFE28552.1 D-tyrosyl-tRNA(Tyr) deacylase [Filifactor alocis ATCC 35896]